MVLPPSFQDASHPVAAALRRSRKASWAAAALSFTLLSCSSKVPEQGTLYKEAEFGKSSLLKALL